MADLQQIAPPDASQREELERVLASRTFHRSDLLRKLLRFVCELELEGKRSEISEQSIGVRALGRPDGFVPDLDSSVRTRTHALRKKLEEYYAAEGAGSRVRIDLPKGSYVPVFLSGQGPERLPVVQPAASRRMWAWFAAGFLVCGLLGAAVYRAGWIAVPAGQRTPEIVRSFWAPFFDGGPAVICVGQPVHLWVRQYGEQPLPTQYPPFPDPAPTSEAFASFYREITGASPPKGLVLHPSPNAPLWGDISGAAMASRFLERHGVAHEFLPERTIRGNYAIRGSNTLIFGRPEFSPLVAEHLQRGYTVRYLPEIRHHAIVLQGDSSKRFMNSEVVDARNFGLITVTSDRALGFRRTIVFAGITSDGSQAGAEFLTSERTLSDLKSAMAREGVNAWPDNFQVVVRTTSSRGYPVKIDYETHLILK